MLKGKRILLGVCGSIAAYKSAYLLRLFVKAGAEVKVITTKGSQKFVTDLTFSNLSKGPVFGNLWEGDWTEHIHLANWADFFIVAPITANTIAKFAHGICDNMMTAIYLSTKIPVFVAPAMDADMMTHQATTENLSLLERRGVVVIPSGEGEHASGLKGPGRFAEPEDILEFLNNHQVDGPLKGKKVLVSAGPTRESLDPVRFISNHSTGTMGFAIAAAAQKQGAEVTLVKGPVSIDPPNGVNVISIESAEDLFNACEGLQDQMDIIIMTAAVADFTPGLKSDKKIKKEKGKGMTLDLVRTKDVLKHMGSKKDKSQILVGFALETNNEEANAKRKLENKNLDLIVLNSLQDKGAGFGKSSNKITIFDRRGNQESFPLKAKSEAAKDLINYIIKHFCDDK